MRRSLLQGRFIGGLGLLLVGMSLVLLTAGCSASRSVNRSKVLEAENIDLRQRADLLEGQVRDAHAGQDHAVAEVQELRVQKQDLENQAADASTQASNALARLNEVESDLTDAERERAALRRKVAELNKRPPVVRAPVSRRGTPDSYVPGPELAALQRDIQQRLNAAGVRGLPVEVRTARDGSRRVAVVLQDAFPSGKATLADNADAVKAVIGLGKMVQDSYPGSRIAIEGHTDSDPIRKSSWGTNENLSRARADAVKRLLTNTGLPNGQISVAGRGADQPLARGSSRRAKSQNRRVELFISPR